MTSPLPHGCKFFIWPKSARHRKDRPYSISYYDREVSFSGQQARIFLLLLTNKGRHFSYRELADEIYKDDKNGGPVTWPSAIRQQIYLLKARFKNAGLSLNLKNGNNKSGFVFTTIGIIDNYKVMRPQVTEEARARQRWEYNVKYFVPERDPTQYAVSERVENQQPIHSLPDRR